ncbi:MAG: hypothetical protein IJ828_06705, partial [Treponema sp.]|nr:hypothetical protein [Treponema sp.]
MLSYLFITASATSFAPSLLTSLEPAKLIARRFSKAFRDAAPDLTMEKLLRRILTETDVLPVCSVMSDGKRRYANLMQLIGMASDFESEGFHGLHSFVHYLEKKKNKNTAP